ncbi:MAG: multiheme c-type cytochrome [Crocinitomicaceae bacterium]
MKIKRVIFLGMAGLLFASCEESAVTILPLTKTWEIAVPNQEIPEGLTSLSSEQCGACHQDHYNEWKISTHAQAWKDLQFQAELKKESSPFMCINCHIPLQNQQEYIVEGLIDGDIYQPVKRTNYQFDEKLQQEGINCVSCHVRNNAVIGMTGSKKAPHKTVKDPTFLSEKLCISCHNATAVVTPTLACSFETGDEWKKGPFFGEKNCISCHMETMERPLVFGFEPKKSHFHSFPGSGIPKFDSLQPKILNGLSFSYSNPKKVQRAKTPIDFEFYVKNEFAGHKVPTGDPERFILIEFAVRDSKGNIVHQQTERIGEEWVWSPRVRKISDNNLFPGEERNYSLHFIPKTKGNYVLNIEVTKHRLNQKSANYNKLGSNYPLFISIYQKEFQLQVN